MKHAFDRLVQYLQKNYFSYWIVLGIDTFIALVCTWVSFIGIHYITETPKEITALFYILAISVVSSILGSVLFHTYRNTIRFSQLKELWRLSNCHLVPSVSNGLAQQSENSLCTVRWHAYFYCHGRVPYPVDSGL